MPNDKIKHGRSKLISNYGGVGSLIETQDCSIMIETFDNWQYKDLSNKLSAYIIKDDRLLHRLKNRFSNIRHIVQIPTDKNSFTDHVRPSANYFSKWFYCPRCNRFADYPEWLKRWNASGKKKEYFNPPKCTNAGCKEETLEQIRFVMTCKDGHIHDIPWKHWNVRLQSDQTHLESENEEDGEVGSSKPRGPQLDLLRTCCDRQNLNYIISKENTELSGIWVVCKNCKAERNLKGVFNFESPCEGKKYWIGMTNEQWSNELCDKLTKVTVKTSNSVYYANSLSSIYIPTMQLDSRITNEIRIEIDNMLDSGEFTSEEIIKNISVSKKIPKEIIKGYLENGDEATYIPEEIFRQAEYHYFLTGEQPDNNQLKFRLLECSNQIYGFEKLVKLEKLKKITVQTSFTRQEPIDVDSILQEDTNYEYTVKRQSVSKNNFNTKLFPGVESFGEGILFVLDVEKLNRWETQEKIIERTNILKTNAYNSSWQYHKIIARTLTPRKVLIHTLSHLLIRELEYVCGYPASSLQERLYVSDTMHGFLISAFDGTDGYLGGLANLCNDLDILNDIIQSAINRANDCSSDPICMESDGQGVSQLNLAACHSCSLTPEITCELSNLFLDRKLLVNETFGYFNSILQDQ